MHNPVRRILAEAENPYLASLPPCLLTSLPPYLLLTKVVTPVTNVVTEVDRCDIDFLFLLLRLDKLPNLMTGKPLL